MLLYIKSKLCAQYLRLSSFNKPNIDGQVERKYEVAVYLYEMKKLYLMAEKREGGCPLFKTNARTRPKKELNY